MAIANTQHINDAWRLESVNQSVRNRPVFGAHAAMVVATAAMLAIAHDSPAGEVPYVVTATC